MSELTRRQMVGLAGTFCVSCASALEAAESDVLPYCRAEYGSSQLSVRRVTDRVGLNWIDDVVGPEVRRLSDFFSVRPSIHWADMNTLAFVRLEPHSGYDGAIFLSRALLSGMTPGGPDAANALFTILAHEYAHLYQMAQGFLYELGRDRSTKRAIELHADYLVH